MEYFYKDNSFFTEYFNNLPDFNVVEEFCKSEVKGEENLYVGCVEVIGAMYPIKLRVEIPTTFPHNKLVFRTDSLYGYPHLIYTGKTQYGSWFCLNTPFAETPEEQLNQEVIRLREWIEKELVDGRPQRIEDEKTREALRILDAYEFENFDEMNEYREDARFTVIGDYFSNPDNFKENKGYINCVRNGSNLFYALINDNGSNTKLPYIIVEDDPSVEELKDFMLLRQRFNFDDETCKFLLPGMKLSFAPFVGFDFTSILVTVGDDALNVLQKIKDRFSEEEVVLPVATKNHQSWWKSTTFGKFENSCLTKEYIDSVRKHLDDVSKKIKGYMEEGEEYGNTWTQVYNMYNDPDDYIPGEAEAEHIVAQHLHYFLLGIKNEGVLKWYILSTNKDSKREKVFGIDLSEFFPEWLSKIDNFIPCLEIREISKVNLDYELAETISADHFFGRGSMTDNLINKRVAIVGCGAIGSMVAESLARSGVKSFGLYDDDLVMPGNICRSTYCSHDIGNSKVFSLREHLVTINPFIEIKSIRTIGDFGYSSGDVNDIVRRENCKSSFVNGSFYGDINYNSQEKARKEIESYDIIIDCTASNEMLHFLSYIAPDKDIISLCITNHSYELVCSTSRNGNPFELRKAYLAKLVQDTKNFFHEGSGCYSPTFLATNSDIASLVQLCVRDINKHMTEGKLLPSTIYSHNRRGILADTLVNYRLSGYDILLTIPEEVLLDAEEMDDTDNRNIGFVFGCYSADGKMIMVTHIVEDYCAHDKLIDAAETSGGVIDYIGDYDYSGQETGTYQDDSLHCLIWKAEEESINTKNPLLAVRNTDGSVSFFLYINNELVPFIKQGI